jgi:hypothetical protein
MAITTEIKFNRGLTPEEWTLVNDQLAVYVAEGVTDGIKNTANCDPRCAVVRTWTTTEAASAWVDFASTHFTPGPLYATVNNN